ncbi:MAG: hypothetical protein Q9193_004112 [Seirophora villosa]
MAICLTYLAYRTKHVFSSPDATLLIWATLAIEIAIAGKQKIVETSSIPRLLVLLSTFGLVRNAKGVRLPQPISNDSKLPKIDIFITYCGEGLEVLTDTVKAACHQYYPPSLFRVTVLDDSSSRDVSSAIAELQPVVRPSLHYATRNVKHHTHSKAANLNFGVHFIDTLPNERADYLAVLDVDMIPSPHWLRTVLSHLLHDPSVGLACPFQRAYNIAPNDPLGITPVAGLFEITTILQDLGDSGVCTGSGFLIRRSALDAIKGFPEESLQEDVLTTMALFAKGFRTVYVDGELQWGLAADTVPDWIRQRQRWTAGFLSISSYVFSKQGRDLPLGVRVSGALLGFFEGTTSGIWTIALFLVPLLVATGRPLLPLSSGGATPNRLPFRLAVLEFAAHSIVQALLCSLVDWRCDMLASPMQLWMAPYRLLSALRFYCFPKLLGHEVPAFTPTGISAALGKAEREARKRRRSCKKIVLWDCGAWIFLVVLGCCLLGGVRMVECMLSPWFFAGSKVAGRDVLEKFLVGMGWPPLFSFCLLSAKSAWTPISYAFDPPAVVEREQLLDRTDQAMVAHPKKNVKERGMRKKSQFFWLALAVYHVLFGMISESIS